MMIKHPIKEFHVDDNLYKNVSEARKRIEKDKDVVFLVCGDPGTGKSTISSQIGYLLSSSIVNDNCFHGTVESFRNYALHLYEKNKSKGRANFHDEARETGGTNVITKRIKIHWDFIYENRFLNMIQGLIQSDFWNTPKDVIFHRALFMVWFREDARWKNGVYLFYSKGAMKKLYLRGKKNWDRSPTGYDFKGRFTKFWAANQNYLKQKADNFYNKYNKHRDIEKYTTLRDAQVLAMSRNSNFRAPLFAKVFRCDVSQVYKYEKEWELGK